MGDIMVEDNISIDLRDLKLDRASFYDYMGKIYSSPQDYQQKFAQAFLKSGKLNEITDETCLFYLFVIPNVLSSLIGTPQITQFFIKYFYKVPGKFIKTLIQLSPEDFNRLFDLKEVHDSFMQLNEETLQNILNKFLKNGNFSWMTSQTFVDKLLSLDSRSFYSLLENIKSEDVINYFKKNGNIDLYIKFLHSILNKFYTVDVFLKDENLEYHSIISKLVPLGMESLLDDSFLDLFQNYRKYIRTVNQNVYQVISEKLKEVLLPLAVDTKLDSEYPYYDMEIQIGTKIESLCLANLKGPIDLVSLFTGNLEYSQALLEGRLKVLSIQPNLKKSNLVITKEKCPNHLGLNEIVLNIDGNEERILINLQDDYLDLSYFSETKKSCEKAQKISIKEIIAYPSYNQKVSEPGIYQVTIDFGDKTESYFMETKDNNLEVDRLLVNNQLFFFFSVLAQKSPEIEVTDSFGVQNYSASQDIFKSKYGGNQSDVAMLIKDFYKENEMSTLDFQKAQLLISFINKYFPNIEDAQKLEIANTYAVSGCGFMAIANAFATYIGSLENGESFFKEVFGYDLYYLDGENKVYNLEAIAFDMYLNFYSKKYPNVDEFIKKALGINKDIEVQIFQTYFQEHGINCNFREVAPTSKAELLAYLSVYKDSFLLLTADHFDLKSLSSENQNLSLNYDASLGSSTFENGAYKNIDSHMMLVTDITENLDFIVSSWSSAYQFLKNDKNDFMDYLIKNKEEVFPFWTIQFLQFQPTRTFKLEENIEEKVGRMR